MTGGMRHRRPRSRAWRLGGRAATAMLACVALAAGLATNSASATGHGAVHEQTCQQQFSHNAKARAICIKNSPSTHGRCSLKDEWFITSGRKVEYFRQQIQLDPYGSVLLHNEFSVTMKVLHEHQPEGFGLDTVAAEATIYDPRIEICKAIFYLTLGGHPIGPPVPDTYHLKIGRHGGLSSSVTLPSQEYFPIPSVIDVYARRR